MPSFSNTLEQAIHAALAQANARRHELATLEHLLLALLDEPDAQKVMRACSVDIEELRGTLVAFIDDDLGHDAAIGVLHHLAVLIDLYLARGDNRARDVGHHGPAAEAPHQDQKA